MQLTKTKLDRDQRRELILDVAQEVFLEEGFANASMSVIATRGPATSLPAASTRSLSAASSASNLMLRWMTCSKRLTMWSIAAWCRDG